MFIKVKGEVFCPLDSSTRILVGGDVTFDNEIRVRNYYGVYRLKEKQIEKRMLKKIKLKFWKAFCKLFFASRFYSARIEDGTFIELLVQNSENEKLKFVDEFYKRVIRLNINYSSPKSQFDYPFEKIASFMKKRDLVLVNLETALASHLRVCGLCISDPRYAKAMKSAGISMVSLANNHIFDAGENGFLETIKYLEEAGISYTGAGKNFEDARLGKLIQLNGMKFIFLSYTQFCNSRYTSIAADYPGILPLDRQLIVEDIKVARKNADFVFVCLHWGEENQPRVHHKQIEIAHLLIDEGADGIIGHHPHVPHGIEIYKKKPILYSLGNFIFGFTMVGWGDNYLAEMVINQNRIQGLIIYPISGQGQELFQPELLNGDRADAILHELQIKSAVFNTGIAVQNHIGYIKIQ